MDFYFSPIHDAAENGDLEEVMLLVEQEPYLVHSQEDENGSTPFHLACDNGHVEVVVYLLEQGARINQDNNYGWTPLLIACSGGPVALVDLLLERGADPAASNSAWSCLSLAAFGRFAGSDDVVRRLLQYQPPIPLDPDALKRACIKGNSEVVRMLLEAGVDPTIPDIRGKTPMDDVQEKGHQSCIELLQEWDRSYLITKARRLYDARHPPYNHTAATTIQTRGRAKRGRVEAAPIYLKARMERDKGLPEVEVVVADDDGGKEDVVGSVLEYVVCGGLDGELFVELMEVIGRTGMRG